MRTSTAHTAIFVHGAGGGGWEWAIWARVFTARDWNVLAPDLHAATDGLAATRLADYVEQVRGWCASRALPVLIGASLGARLALAAADLAAALVLVNPLLPKTGLAPRPAIVPWGARRKFESTRRAMPDADDAAVLFAYRRWRDESGAAIGEAFATPLPSAPSCPVLVFAGETDTDALAAHTRAWAHVHDVEFRLVPNAGHLGPLLGRTAAHCAEIAADWLPNRR